MMQPPLMNQPRVQLERIFVRKMRWHAERSAVLSPALEQPKLNVQLDIRHNPLPGQPLRMKLELVLNAVCQSASTEAFHAKIHLAGLFKLEDPRHGADPQVIDFCAAQVYPHLRRLFSNQTLVGGFQGLLLHDRHLETALSRLFMGSSTPQAGFAPVFGTLPVTEPTIQPAKITPPQSIKKRSGPPAILRILSRRALRSRWLYLALSLPIWSGLFIGIGWWLAERDHLQSLFGAQITAMIKPDLSISQNINAETSMPVPPAPATPPAPLDDSKPSASAQILRLEKDGRDWLSAQPDNAFTVILAKSSSARSLVNQIDELTINSPVFLVGLNGGRYAAITGTFSNATEAQRESTRLAKRWPALKPEVLPIAKVRSAQ